VVGMSFIMQGVGPKTGANRFHRNILFMSFFLFSLVFACGGTRTAKAQEFRATIRGTVVDVNHHPVKGAKITATELATTAKTQTISASDGIFVIPDLTPSGYELLVEAHGFKTYLRKGILLTAGVHGVVNVSMERGRAAETVVVVADVATTDTTSSSTGQGVSGHQLADIPNDGGTPAMQAQISVGVSSTGAPGLQQPYNAAGASQVSLAGTPSGTSEAQIDGASDNEWEMRIPYNPPFTALQEVHTYIFQPDAAYGHSGGGIINQVTKGGGNGFHGTVYEFNQVSALRGNIYFNKRNNIARPVTRYNQYGLSAGGPIFIPHVFDGRKKLFWNFSWEGVRDSQPIAGYTTVPTLAERGQTTSASAPGSSDADFSSLLSVGSNYKIYDPNTAVQNSSGVITRSAFANNVIPAARLSSVAKAYLNYYPLPNATSQRADGYNNYYDSEEDPDLYDNQLGRIDYIANQKDKVIFTMHHTNYVQPNAKNVLHSLGTGQTLFRNNWGAMLDNVYSLNHTTIIDTRVSWLHFREAEPPASQVGFDASTLGFPSYMSTGSWYKDMPLLKFGTGACSTMSGSTFTSGSNFQCIGSGTNATPFDSTFDNYQIFADVSKQISKHTLKVGVDVRQARRFQTTFADSNGTFTFGPNFTESASNGAAAPLGQEFASFLLGLPTAGNFQLNSFSAVRNTYMALFIQDDWHIVSSLTVNLGVRYEHGYPMSERHNRTINGFDTTASNPIAASAIAAYNSNPISQIAAGDFAVPGGLTFASSAHPQMFDTPSQMFSPRIGFAWTPPVFDRKTVVRGGFGLFVFPLALSQNMNQEGFTQSTTYIATNDNYLTAASTLDDPFSSGITQPTGSSLGLATYNGKNINFFSPSMKNGYSERWQLQFQRPIGKDSVAEVSYIGNHAVRITVSDNQLNDVKAAYQSKLATRDSTTISALTSSVANPFAGLLPGTSLNGSTVSAYQLLVSFPEYPQSSTSVTSNSNSTTSTLGGGIDEQDMNNGTSYFESLNLRFDHRLSHSFFLTANYTWSKLIEEDTKLNNVDTHYEKRIASYDHPHRISVAGTYALPFGRGKLISSSNGVVNRVIEAWGLNGSYSFQSGAPVIWGNLIYNGGSLHWNARNTTGKAFDTTQFNTNSAQQLQYNIRTFPSTFGKYRQDANNSFNASISKAILLPGHANFQLRCEAYNLLNHATFNSPNVTATSSAFGTITNQYNSPRALQISGRIIW